MLDSFNNNAYRILGIDITASEKEILKRSKEIIKLLQIDDIQDYEIDFDLPNNFRNENSIKKAVQKLQSSKKKIKEFFFWFQISDGVDKQSFGLLKINDYINAYRVWQIASNKKTVKAFTYKKNLAILYCFLLLKEDNNDYLKDSLTLWEELINSEKFWNYFIKLYNLYNEQTDNESLIVAFRNQVVSFISDIYTELYKIHKNTSYISEFQNTFSAGGEQTEKTILEPIYLSINDSNKKLESMKISMDGVLDKEETIEIKKVIGSIQSNLNKLIDLGFYDVSQTKVMRDRSANAIRLIVLDLHNNLSETNKAFSLLNIALKIVGTSSCEAKILQDIHILENIKKNADLVKPINDLIEQKEYEKALKIIIIDQAKHKSNQDLVEFYNNQKKICITLIAIKINDQARDCFDKKRFDEAKSLYEEVGKYIYGNIDLFNFNKKVIDEMLDKIDKDISNLRGNKFEQINEYRNSYIKMAKDNFEGQFEESTFILLVDSHIFSNVGDFINRIKNKNNIVNFLYLLGWLTVWYNGIGLIFFIAGFIYKSKD